MVAAFVRVNIEDDLYIQSNKANTSTELDFDEFFEVLARMHHSREGGEKTKKAKRLLDEDEGLEMARNFDAWLARSFFPAATEAIKTRRKKVF